jgi:iron complex outermembrane receptor protein
MRLALGTLFVASALRGSAQLTLPSSSELKKFSVDELMELEVTSVSKHPEKLFEAASAIQVITDEDIRRSGATSLPEALRLASNLEVAQIDSRQWAISARGFNNLFADKMLVLMDGRTVYTPLYAGVYWDVQDTLLEDLDRIEVISGPGGAQWGANAMNGVINITTKSAKDTQGALITAKVGSIEDAAAVRYGGEVAPGVYYRVYGKAVAHGESIRTVSGTGADDEWRQTQGGFRLDAATAAGNQFTLQGDLYTANFGRLGPDDIEADGRNLLGRWSRDLGNGADLRLQVYYDHTHRVIPGSFTQTLNTYDTDFQHRFPLAGGRHEIVWGFAYRVVDDDIVNTPANAFLPAQVTRQWFSGFLQDEIALSENRLRLTLGAKLEHNDYTGFEVEPTARVAWTPDQRHTLWAAISHAVRTPSRIDRDLYSPATPPYRIAGGPNVVSENVVAYELGYRQQLSSRLTLGLAAFYNDYGDLRSLEPLNPPAPFPIERSSGLLGHSSGAELTLEWQATAAWRLFAGYTALRVHSEAQPGNMDLTSDRNMSRDPNQQFVLRSLLNLSARWELDATVRAVGPISHDNVPGYVEADLHLGWHAAPGWTFSLVGQNLVHDHHAEFNAQAGRREIPRSVYLQGTWSF